MKRPMQPSPLPLWALLALSISCRGSDNSVTAPPTVTRRVAVGDTVTTTLNGPADVRSFVVTSSQRLSLQLSFPSGAVHITIADSVHSRVVLTADFYNASTFDHNSTESFDAANTVYTVTAVTDAGATVSLRYIIHVVDTRPEQVPANLIYGQIVIESIANSADIDDFYFDGTKGEDVIVFLQGIDSQYPGGFELSLTSDTSNVVLGTADAQSGATDPEAYATGRVTLPATGRYRMRVKDPPTGYFGPPVYVGRYRLELVRVDHAPEHTSATLVSGDTVETESIDRVGDVDDYPVTIAAGAEFAVFFQTATGPSSAYLICEVLDAAGNQLEAVWSHGTDTLQLLQGGPGRLAPSGTGRYTVRVRGVSDREGLNRGKYRLLFEKVNRGPEKIPAATRAIGDTISGESIDYPGDIDEIPFHVDSNVLVHVEAYRMVRGWQTESLIYHILRASDGSYVTGVGIDYASGALPIGGGSPTTQLDAGDYTLRVFAAPGSPYAYWGGWKAILQAVDSMPEGRSPIIVGGEIVTGASEPPGDIDTYRMAVHPGEHWQILFQGSYNGGVGSTLEWWDDSTKYYPGFILPTFPSAGLADAPSSPRLDVLQPDSYRIRVLSNGRPADRGPYRFVVQPLSVAVEHHTSALVPFDSVTDEKVDTLNDIDRYTFTGVPGRHYVVVFRSNGLISGPTTELNVRVFDPATMSLLTQMWSHGWSQKTTPFTLPASGTAFIEVTDPTGSYSATPYFVRVYPFDPAPENVPSTIALGDTISGETLSHNGDEDTFTFTATAGQAIEIWLDWQGTSSGDGNYILLNLLVGGNDYGAVFDVDPGPGFVGPLTYTVPVTGTYTLQANWADELHSEPVAPYRFVVKPVP